MSSILIERFANQLTTTDIKELFKRLQKILTNRKEAAQKCRLERKTTYDWDRTKEIRFQTKKKVVSALLDELPGDTLDFVTRRIVESASETLRTHLNYLYERMFDDDVDSAKFQQLLARFLEIRREYSGLIVDRLSRNVADILGFLDQRASELGTKIAIPASDVARFSKLGGILSSLARALSSEFVTPNVEIDIAKKFNIPVEFLHSFLAALKEYSSSKQETLRSAYPEARYPQEPRAHSFDQQLKSAGTPDLYISTPDAKITIEFLRGLSDTGAPVASYFEEPREMLQARKRLRSSYQTPLTAD